MKGRLPLWFREPPPKYSLSPGDLEKPSVLPQWLFPRRPRVFRDLHFGSREGTPLSFDWGPSTFVSRLEKVPGGHW